ncbi:UNVERIFIED_CONTAM: hypothetical protein PYX00_009738 [Menopon gallinae]
MICQCLRDESVPHIKVIAMSDLMEILKPEGKEPANAKKKGEKKNEKKPKDEPKQRNSLAAGGPRFAEVLSFISKNATIPEGDHSMDPTIMAYAVKYMILNAKNKDYYQRRVNFALKKKMEENEVKKELLRKLNKTPVSKSEVITEKNWYRDLFDILDDDPLRSGPFNGPEMYFVLYDFYNPMIFAELQKLKVPFKAVIRVESVLVENLIAKSMSRRYSEICNFWANYEANIQAMETTMVYKDIAPILYLAPSTPIFIENTEDELPKLLLNDILTILYSIFNLYRLHVTYITKMRVHRMVESLEPLDLSECRIYKQLCDETVLHDQHAEIFVLFAMIEQVAAGVPETAAMVIPNVPEQLDFFADVPPEEPKSREAVKFKEPDEEAPAKCPVMRKGSISDYPKSNGIYLHDDQISLAAMNIDRSILKIEDIFKRFIINSAMARTRSKFPNLSPATKALNEFQFFRIWERSREKESLFREKMLFFVVMRLFERTQVLDACSRGGNNIESYSDSSSHNEMSLNANIQSDVSITSHQAIPSNRDLYLGDFNMFYGTANVEHFPFEEWNQTQDGTLDAGGTLKRATAIEEMPSKTGSSADDFNLGCGRCLKMPLTKDEGNTTNLNYLRRLLESNEVVFFNEPNLLVDRKDFDNFVEKHGFLERLEANRSVQRLQCLYDKYNTVEYTYFSPTDTLLVLGMNDSDSRGMFHSVGRGCLITPLGFRDFVTHLVPNASRWMEKQDAQYLAFLKGLKTTAEEKKRKKLHSLRCDLLRRHNAGEPVLIIPPKDDSKSTIEGSKKGGGKKEKGGEKKEKGAKKKRKESEFSEATTLAPFSEYELEDLPVKAKMNPPKKIEFEGINYSPISTEVGEEKFEFHSKDGSYVKVSKHSWLYGDTSLTVTVRREDTTLYLHKWKEGEKDRKYVHLRGADGIRFSLNIDQSPLQCSVTWPNGLIIQPRRSGEEYYIKQGYLNPYRERVNIEEEYRCCLQNGHIYIQFEDGKFEVLTPSGGRYRGFVSKNTEEPPSEPKEGIEIDELLSSTGLIWIRSPTGRCVCLEKTLSIIGALDTKTKETFYRREDGTSFMLWPSGKLVTSYPDGTKITVVPQFGDEIDLEEEERDDEVKKAKKRRTNTEESFDTSKHRILFYDDFQKLVKELSSFETFQLIDCTYLMEHPKYATVHVTGSETEVKMFGHKRMDVTPKGEFKIDLQQVVLEASSDDFYFYNTCKDCSEKSMTCIYYETNENEALCKTTDLNKMEFTVYGSGKVFLRDISKESESEEGEGKFDSDRIEEKEECLHPRACKLPQKCLALYRDMTGVEFLSDAVLTQYTGTLSNNAYIDLFKPSRDGTELQHCFFNPIYKTGNEKYLMSYEEGDGCPLRIKRRHLVPLKDIYRNHPTFHGKPKQSQKGSGPPKPRKPTLTIARFLTVLTPSPNEIFNDISEAIVVYQKRAFDTFDAFKKIGNFEKQKPFDNYVDRELRFIASRLCRSLDLYPHTCTIVPTTELDIHSMGHKQNLNNEIAEENPDDVKADALPQCTRIIKPLRHDGRDTDILEVSDTNLTA